MFKMRGLILLCLVGFILSASLPKGNAAPPQHTGKILPFEGEGGFEAVAPVTQVPGLSLPLENEGGFNSTNSTPTATPKATTAPVKLQHTGYILPFEGEGAIPTAASVENAQQAAKNKD